MTVQVLVVDDDPVQRRVMKTAMERCGYQPLLAEHGRAGLELLKQRGRDIGAAVIDLGMKGMDGIAFLEAAADLGTDLPIIVQAGQGGMEAVVQAMRAGAFDFVVKPVSPERLGTAIAGALRPDHAEAKGRPVRRSRAQPLGLGDIVSASAAMVRVVELARRAIQSAIPVALEGEAGVGKEMIARIIHTGSERANKPFITVNCTAVAPEELETLLFGEAKTAAAEADRQIGKLIEADGGSLFLDEIGDLPLDVQARLLRVVQRGEIETAGAGRPRKVNVRLISATAKNLIEEVKEGRFREDLYYRLNVFPITIPALRRRKEDIPYLVRTFAERFSAEQKLPHSLGVSAGALALLTAYDWPGNVRQLENAVFHATMLAKGQELTEKEFPQISRRIPGFSSTEENGEAGEQARSLLVVSPERPEMMRLTADTVPSSSETGAAQTGVFPGGSLIASTDDSGNVRTITEIEEELIRFALRFYRGQMSQVARKLGIGRSTLYRKLKDYGIDPDNPLHDAA